MHGATVKAQATFRMMKIAAVTGSIDSRGNPGMTLWEVILECGHKTTTYTRGMKPKKARCHTCRIQRPEL